MVGRTSHRAKELAGPGSNAPAPFGFEHLWDCELAVEAVVSRSALSVGATWQNQMDLPRR
jgi:hypothetical protein